MLDRQETVNVIREEPELAERIGGDRLRIAERLGRALMLRVPAGDWNAAEQGGLTRGGYGLLVLRGWLLRRVGIGDRIGAELLGPGDLLRPLEHDGEEATLPFEARWRVVEPLCLAVLDRDWSFRMAVVPEVGIEVGSRAIRRSRRLANTLAIAQHAKLDQGLHLLLWELADRYGRVRSDGVHLELPLTHELLAYLAAARRPSISSSMARLTKGGLVRRTDRGYVLLGTAPAMMNPSQTPAPPSE